MRSISSKIRFVEYGDLHEVWNDGEFRELSQELVAGKLLSVRGNRTEFHDKEIGKRIVFTGSHHRMKFDLYLKWVNRYGRSEYCVEKSSVVSNLVAWGLVVSGSFLIPEIARRVSRSRVWSDLSHSANALAFGLGSSALAGSATPIALGSMFYILSQQGVSGQIVAPEKINLLSDGRTMDVIRVGEEFRVNSCVLGNQTMPRIETLGDNNFVVVWSSDSQDGSSDGVYAQLFNSDGIMIDYEFRVNNYTAGSQRAFGVSKLGASKFIVVWCGEGADGNNQDVYAKIYHNDGLVAVDEFRVNE